MLLQKTPIAVLNVVIDNIFRSYCAASLLLLMCFCVFKCKSYACVAIQGILRDSENYYFTLKSFHQLFGMIFVICMQNEIPEDVTALEVQLVFQSVKMTICKHNTNYLDINTLIRLDGSFVRFIYFFTYFLHFLKLSKTENFKWPT